MNHNPNDINLVRSSLVDTRTHIIWATATFVLSVALAFLFRLLLASLIRNFEVTDYVLLYRPVADEILQGNGFHLQSGMPAIAAPPGYPLVLAAIFGLADVLNISRNFVLTSFLVLCSGLSSLLIFKLASLIWKPPLAFISAMLWATYPLALWFNALPLSGVVFLPVFLASFYLFARALLGSASGRSVYFAVGLLSGVAILIRPAAIGIGFVLALLVLVTKNEHSFSARIPLAALILAGNLVAVLPWEVWMFQNTGRIIPLSTGGRYGTRDGLTFAVADKGRAELSLSYDVLQFQRAIYDQYPTLTTLNRVATVTAAQAQQQPVAFLKLMAIKAARSWYGTDSQRLDRYIMLGQLPYGILILLGGIIAWGRDQPTRTLLCSIGVITLYFWSMTVLTLSIVRYMLPTFSLLTITLPAIIERSSVRIRLPRGGLPWQDHNHS